MKGAGWPVHKLSEVEQENGLDLILRRSGSLRPETTGPGKQHDRTEETSLDDAPRSAKCSIGPWGQPQNRHSTRP